MPLLASISRELERQAARSPHVAADQQLSRQPRPLESIDTVYEELAANLAFVATLSVGISPNLRPGLRGVRIRDDDPFQGTWNVVVLGAHFAAMLAAREDGQAESDDDQAFHFVVTYDRDITVECGKPSCSALTGG